MLPDHHNPGHASDWQARLFSELIASRALTCLGPIYSAGTHCGQLSLGQYILSYEVFTLEKRSAVHHARDEGQQAHPFVFIHDGTNLITARRGQR